jgi:hypothetical protein
MSGPLFRSEATGLDVLGWLLDAVTASPAPATNCHALPTFAAYPKAAAGTVSSDTP